MTDKYYRLVTILVNICPNPLRELFLKQAATDPNLQTPYTTLDAYLAFRRNDINKLTQKPKCLLQNYQFDLLFPSGGKGQTDIGAWDVTLLISLLKNIFNVAQSDLICIENIRNIRNDLQHIAGTCQITEQDFKNIYTALSANILQLALSAKGQCYEKKIKQDIEEVQSSVLTDLGDVLRSWYMSKIVKLEAKIEHLKDQIGEIKQDTGKTKKTLKKTTVKRTRAGGKLTKRFKTIDHILENMRENFASLLTKKLDSDFTPPPENAKIIAEIEDNHLVVVSGYGKGLYLQAALYAINSKGYEEHDCILCSRPTDWRHIGKEDAKLVVFLHPFGKGTFDLQKAKDFRSIVDSIVETTSSSDNDDVLDVVIILDQSILVEWKRHFSHDMMEQPILVYKPTTVDTPVDLIEGEFNMSNVEADPRYENLLVQSIAYNKHHRAKMADEHFLESALAEFRSKKVIVISGPRGSGKTTLALSLLSSYQDGHYLILTEPDDLSCVRFGVTCVVIIEDLGGKYTFEMSVIQKWLRKFDMLYSAVKDGKLNVIITCLTDRLISCVHDSKHPMLETVIELPKDLSVEIKKESLTDGNSVMYAGISTNTSSYNRVKKIQTHTFKTPENVKICYATECCQHPDGSFLYLAIIRVSSFYENEDDSICTSQICKYVIIHISSDFEYKCYYNTGIKENYNSTKHICCTDTGDVVMYVKRKLRLYRISSGRLQFIKSTDMKFECTNISFFKNKIYCFTKMKSLILDTNLNKKKGVERDDISVKYTLPCSLQKYISISESDCVEYHILCEDSRLKQLKYFRKEGFLPLCMCAATENSVFLFGTQDDDYKILQVNTDMTVISEICMDENEMGLIDMWDVDKMVFDKDNSRLVITFIDDDDDDEFVMFHTIYLE
ncbi:uncharacterized protein LOC132758493 [Ruditapes philippinarum]|uniref:uncharacterized protein LOC132758493 n=1 Tax=Ruditapes philippinarum TaxID=129788 RepID=UPI00295B72C3|nr:uncharacterized protein LOC132758493 [Ruditapes philippinarum]